jgi:DNA-binding NtrC family response regulator
MRILVIDDDESVRGFVVAVLLEAGHVVVEASDGAEGLKLNKDSPSDLIITDLFMPETDGLAVVMELKRIRPDVKIITISGAGKYGGPGSLRTAELLGSTYTLEKPFSPDKLLELVDRALAQH